MASQADVIGIGIIVTAGAGIKIIHRFPCMLSTAGSAGPSDKTVTFGHYHPCLVAIDAKGMLLVAGKTVVFIPSCQNSVIIYKIQRMRQAVEIVALMAGGAVAVLVAM